MKWLAIPLSLVWIMLVLPAQAQKPDTAGAVPVTGISPGDIAPTPEMWFYQQYQREYQDPKLAVRRLAEYRTFQRQMRMAARQWYGFSNARPRAATDPFNGDYSPAWTGPSHLYPFRWNMSGVTAVVVRPESRTEY